MKPALGVCYYPEHWPEAIWESDARRMAEAGISTVRIGEMAWSRIEPKPGTIRTEWLRHAMDILHAAGLRIVVATPTAAPPRWLVEKMPDMLQVDEEGRVRKFGSRRHYCFSHAGYREECARIATILATALKDHPGLTAWQIDNGYGGHGTALSYSGAALAAFRDWLKDRYASIEALNAAWGNVFWSMDYSSFDQIELPNLTPAEANPSHSMDFRRFSSDQVIAFNKAQIDALRAVAPNTPITGNFMNSAAGFDHYRTGDHLDFASWSSYPLGKVAVYPGASADRGERYARQGDPDLQAFHHDLYRHVGKGRFWVMEQQPGPVNRAGAHLDPLSGAVRLWSWEAFAHGAETVCYSRWRQVPFAQEQMHSGLLLPDGEPAPALAEVRQVSEEFAQLESAPVAAPADCAIVYDYASAWAWELQPHGPGFGHHGTALAQYRQLRKLGFDVDILPPDTSDLTAYKLVFIPSLFAWTDALRRAMAESEALLVIGPMSGSKTRDFRIPPALPPDLPETGVRVVRVESLPSSMRIPVKGGGSVFGWREKIETREAVLIESHDGWPILTRAQRYFYLAALLDEEAHRSATRRLVQFAGLRPFALPEGVRTRRSGETTFIFNYGPDEHDLEALGFRRPFGLDGSHLRPAGVATARWPSR